MTLQHDDSRKLDAEQERSIVRYLRDHPDFFERHLDLLADMVLPHESGKAISLIERQVSILREQKEQHKHKLQQLIKNAQQNEQLVNKLNSLIHALMDASSLEQVLNLVQHRLQDDFAADVVSVRLLNSSVKSDKATWSEQELAAFEQVVGRRKPLCGQIRPEQMQALFDDVAEQIHSVALVPLVTSESSKQCLGLLAIGSKDSHRFAADMDTMFLEHLGNVLTRVIKHHVGE